MNAPSHAVSLPSTMCAIAIPSPGGPEALQPAILPLPDVRPGEILVRVAAAGLNAPDLAQRRGHYPPPPGASPLPGLEVAGTVAALGEGARRFALGDQVAALCNGGGYAEFVAVPEGQALPLPAGWSPAEAAALPETYFTIQQTLVMKGHVGEGDVVLIHGGAGGIGGAAIVIARLYGATPIAVVSSPEKAEYAARLGATATIDRRNENIVERVRALTGGRGANCIIDIVGGPTLGLSLEAAATEGRLLVLATLSGGYAEINAGLIVSRRLTLYGSTLRPQPPAVKAAIAGSLAERVWPALATGKVPKPFLQRFALAEAAAAHRAMEAPGHFGKIVLVTGFGEAG